MHRPTRGLFSGPYGPRSLQLLELLEVQGYLAHKKTPNPQDHHRTLGIGPRLGPTRGHFLMSEVGVLQLGAIGVIGDVIRKEAWSFYRKISGVSLCWELEEPKGPKGGVEKKGGVVHASMRVGTPIKFIWVKAEHVGKYTHLSLLFMPKIAYPPLSSALGALRSPQNLLLDQ